MKDFLDSRLIVKAGDITLEEVDAVVNAANNTLLGGSGVDGAIHDRGGPEILRACKEIRATVYPSGLPTGEAVITTAGRMPAKHVIHTVGPIYGMNDGRDAELLEACYRNSILVAVENDLHSIAFPAISTGVFRYPKHEAAPIVAKTIRRSLEDHRDIEEVRLVFFAEPDAVMFIQHAAVHLED
jgi:O-acetyl-ADP-ribose deacetylase